MVPLPRSTESPITPIATGAGNSKSVAKLTAGDIGLELGRQFDREMGGSRPQEHEHRHQGGVGRPGSAPGDHPRGLHGDGARGGQRSGERDPAAEPASQQLRRLAAANHLQSFSKLIKNQTDMVEPLVPYDEPYTHTAAERLESRLSSWSRISRTSRSGCSRKRPPGRWRYGRHRLHKWSSPK